MLEQKLELISKQISKYALGTTIISIVTSLIFLVFLIMFDSQVDLVSNDSIIRVLKIVITAIVLLIVSIPEGLPLVISIAMALSISNLKDDNILIKNLESIQTSALIHELCVSKTGTLTKGVLEVKYIAIEGKTQNV